MCVALVPADTTVALPVYASGTKVATIAIDVRPTFLGAQGGSGDGSHALALGAGCFVGSQVPLWRSLPGAVPSTGAEVVKVREVQSSPWGRAAVAEDREWEVQLVLVPSINVFVGYVRTFGHQEAVSDRSGSFLR